MIRLPDGSGIRADIVMRVGSYVDIDRAGDGGDAYTVTVNGEVCGRFTAGTFAQSWVDRIIAARDTWAGGIDPSAVLGLTAALAEANRQLEQRDDVIHNMIGVIEHAKLIHDLAVEALKVDHCTGEIIATPHGTVDQVRAALDALGRLIPAEQRADVRTISLSGDADCAGLIKIGRAQASKIRVEDEAAARMHAVIEATDRGWSVRDLGTASGTFVNGTKISMDTAIARGDTLRIGNTTFRIKP